VDDRKRWRCSWRITDELLEEADVEDVVQPSVRRQGEAHGNLIDELGDVVRPEEVRLQLPCGRLGQ